MFHDGRNSRTASFRPNLKISGNSKNIYFRQLDPPIWNLWIRKECESESTELLEKSFGHKKVLCIINDFNVLRENSGITGEKESFIV